MEKELLELRNYCVEQEKAANVKMEECTRKNRPHSEGCWYGRSLAFSEFICELDLLLKMNIVKPLDERSPSDEQNQADVSRPNDEAKSE